MSLESHASMRVWKGRGIASFPRRQKLRVKGAPTPSVPRGTYHVILLSAERIANVLCLYVNPVCCFSLFYTHCICDAHVRVVFGCMAKHLTNTTKFSGGPLFLANMSSLELESKTSCIHISIRHLNLQHGGLPRFLSKIPTIFSTSPCCVFQARRSKSVLRTVYLTYPKVAVKPEGNLPPAILLSQEIGLIVFYSLLLFK